MARTRPEVDLGDRLRWLLYGWLLARYGRKAADLALGAAGVVLLLGWAFCARAVRDVWVGLVLWLVVLAALAALLAFPREVARWLRLLLGEPAPAAPVWTGRLFAVYVWEWPAERYLRRYAPDLPLEWAGRPSYIGLDSSGLDERRADAHTRDRRAFVLPGAVRHVHLVESERAMEALEVELIRRADEDGEPIVNKQRHRRRGVRYPTAPALELEAGRLR